jgi:hypothetical protein
MAALIVAVVAVFNAADLMQWLQLLQLRHCTSSLREDKSGRYQQAAHTRSDTRHCKKGNRRYRGTFLCSCASPMPKNNTSKSHRRAAQMPPLYHTLPGQAYADEKSEVLNWLWQQPEIRAAVFDEYGSTRVFDKATGKWRGKSYGVIDTSL